MYIWPCFCPCFCTAEKLRFHFIIQSSLAVMYSILERRDTYAVSDNVNLVPRSQHDIIAKKAVLQYENQFNDSIRTLRAGS